MTKQRHDNGESRRHWEKFIRTGHIDDYLKYREGSEKGNQSDDGSIRPFES